MYDRSENPFQKLQDFLKAVERAYEKKNPKDGKTKAEQNKASVMIGSLSPDAKPILPDSLKDD